MRGVRHVIVSLIVLAATAVWAHAAGPYVGGSVGQSFADVTWDTDVEVDIDSSDFGWKLYGGYDLGRFLAVETGYVDLGTPQGSEGLTSLSQDVWGWDACGLVKLNFGPLDFLGRYGFVVYRAKLSFSSSSGGVVEETDDGTGTVIGAGVALVLPKITLRAEYEHFTIEDAGNPELLTLGVTVSF